MTSNENELMIRNVFPGIYICGPNVRVGADGSRMLSSWFAMGGSESAPPEPDAPQGDTAVIFQKSNVCNFCLYPIRNTNRDFTEKEISGIEGNF